MTAAILSGYAYHSKPDVAFSDIHTFEYQNANGFAAVDQHNDRVWVAFAGTNELEDWRDNVAYSHTKFNGGTVGSVHSGFLRYYEKLDQQLAPIINSYHVAWDRAEIVFCGHSLGGAVAQIAAVKFADAGYRTSAISIGSPRVFCPRAAFYVNHVSSTKVTRVESLTDWTTDVPTRSGRYRYSKAGCGIYIDSRGRVTAEERPWWAKSWQVLKRLVRRHSFVNTHSITEYKRRLEKWILSTGERS